jgi:glutamyl-tRNA reductase
VTVAPSPPSHDATRLTADHLPQLVVLSSTIRHATESERAVAGSILEGLAPAFTERMLFRTCHRVELIGIEGNPIEVPQGVHIVRGREAVERVLTVIAGLDSAIVAEEELLGQARDAYTTALARNETGPVLNELLRRALRLGKQVRASARPGADRSLADRAAGLVLKALPTDGASPAVLVIGAGQMGRRAAARLADGGMSVTVASRDAASAAGVLDGLPGRARHAAVAIAEAIAQTADFAAIVVAVRGGMTLEPELVAGAAIVVDLSTPAAVGPDAASILGDRLVTIDTIADTNGHRALAPSVERRLRAELVAERDRFIAWLAERRAGDAIAVLRRHAAAVRERHLDRLRRGGLLDTRQLAAVEAATAALVGELIHGPTVALRGGGPTAAEVRRIFGFDA